MAKKIFRSVFLLAVTVALVCTVLMTGIIYDYFYDEYITRLKNDSALIAAGYDIGGMNYLNSSDFSGLRITLIEPDGSVSYDNYAEAAKMGNHLDREEVASALENGSGQSERFSETIAKKTFYYALRLSDGRVLRVANSRYTLMALILGLSQSVAVIFIMMAAVCAFFIYRLSLSIVEPINEINLDEPSEERIYSELKPLVKRITAQNMLLKEKMSELSRKQQEFAAITENMSEGIIIADKNRAILSYNSGALRYLKATENSASFVLSDVGSLNTALSEALSEKHYDSTEIIDGVYVQLIANPVYEDTLLVGAVLLILDVTEKEEREKLRREFTANVSHELKTPLTSISGTAEILARGLVKDEDTAHFAENIYTEAQRLISLVGDIIRLSQLDENSFVSEKVKVDLYEVSKSVIERLKDSAEKKSVELKLCGEHCVVFGIAPIIDEMIYNICDNAVKYNVYGGAVNVFVEESNGMKTISVTDTGIGIADSERERVFERFYRVDKSHSKEIGGTGLGLSIVKHGAAYHNATVKLTSADGGGTTVKVSFPVEEINKETEEKQK